MVLYGESLRPVLLLIYDKNGHYNMGPRLIEMQIPLLPEALDLILLLLGLDRWILVGGSAQQLDTLMEERAVQIIFHFMILLLQECHLVMVENYIIN